MSKFVVVLCAFVLLVITPSVHADPVVITSGSVTVVGISGSPTYSISGVNFSVTSVGGDPGNTPNCGPCLSGVPTRTGSFLVGTSLGQGNATINGVTFTNIGFAGSFSLASADAVLPIGTTNITLQIPFFFQGNIRGCSPNALLCTTEVFSTTELIGQGIATVNFNFIGTHSSGASIYFFNSVTYEFQAAEVPEPFSIMLLGSGLIGLGAKLKLRKRRV